MSNQVLPISSLKGLTFSVFKIPGWSRRFQRAMSGRELVLQDYANPIWTFKLPFSHLRDRQIGSVVSEYRLLLDFYNQMMATDDTFLFDDPDDKTVTNQSLGTGDGTTVDFQLVRRLVTSGFVEDIIAPNVITSITINGTPTAAYTLDSTTGIITFTSAPANGAAIAATFTFYFRCRFSNDSIDLKKFANQFWALDELRFRSVVL